MTSSAIRALVREDLSAPSAIVAETGFFPPEMLGDLTSPFLDDESGGLWLVASDGAAPVGFCHAVPEPLAEGVWTMLALGVLPSARRRGLAAALVSEIEARLAGTGARLLIVDTSSGETFAPARRFYASQGYTLEARLGDFWAEGDDKLTFTRRFAPR